MLALQNKLRHTIRLCYVEYLSPSKAANEKIESPAVSEFNQWATHPRDRKTNGMGVLLGSKVCKLTRMRKHASPLEGQAKGESGSHAARPHAFSWLADAGSNWRMRPASV
jgi:hypothetical protein